MKNKVLVFIILAVLLIGCASLGMKGKKTKTQTSKPSFELIDNNYQKVYVAGDFNSWNQTSHPMQKNGNKWQLFIELKKGKYAYKYIADGKWLTDEKNPNKVDDGYGGHNSLLIVDDDIKPVASIRAVAPTENTIKVDFSYKPLTGGKKNVFLTGEFNNWSPSANPMQEKDGNYYLSLNLKPGKYAYKFIVDGKYITDENAKSFIDDGYGGQNSVVFAGDFDELNSLRKVTFSYKPEVEPTDVYIAGSLNNWNQKATPMLRQTDGSWQVTLLLKPDKYTYKFVVNGNNWIADNKATSFEDDGFGGQNSVINVDSNYEKVTIKKADGQILTYGLTNEQNLKTVNPIDENYTQFKYSTHKNDVEKVVLYINNQIIDLEKIDFDDNTDYWEKTIAKPVENSSYCFTLIDGDYKVFVQKNGFNTSFDDANNYVYSNQTIQKFYTPDWVKDGIVYQIFPDRFYNADKTNDPDFSEWYYEGHSIKPPNGEVLKPGQAYYHLVTDWYDIASLTKNPYHPEGKPDWWSFYGGDIKGVEQKLDYLYELGVTIIYFNPIFKAKSNHRYDAADYMMPDPHFGTPAEIKQFVQKAHEKGIKVIVDVAYNHTGETFWAFQDGKKLGKQSKYYNWYEWKKWPLPEGDFKPIDYYECWWGFGEMPNLNFDLDRANPDENHIKNIEDANPNWEVVNYINGLSDYWIGEMDFDGFRLDVPNEVPFWFWKLFRKKVKELKPDAWLVGEIWTNAVDWVNNDYFDSVMNYAYFKDPVNKFFNERSISSKTFDNQLKPGRLIYPVQASQTMMNLIDSHDTFRYLEKAKGDLNKLKMAAFFQMTYVGVPHIWYGDEIGMMGAHDPDCRRPMNWKYTDEPELIELRRIYVKLAKIRRKSLALRRGQFKTITTDGLKYVFSRKYQDEEVIVVINNEETTQDFSFEAKNGTYTNLLTGQTLQVTNGLIDTTLARQTGAIFELMR